METFLKRPLEIPEDLVAYNPHQRGSNTSCETWVWDRMQRRRNRCLEKAYETAGEEDLPTTVRP